MELTLLWAEKQLVFRQYFQGPLDRLFVFLLCLCKDQNVVQVHYHDPFSYEGPEDVVHHSLEGGGVTPDSCLGNKSNIFHHNNKNNQLERQVRSPRDIH